MSAKVGKRPPFWDLGFPKDWPRPAKRSPSARPAPRRWGGSTTDFIIDAYDPFQISRYRYPPVRKITDQ